MKIFLISQNINTDYDTYDSAIVVAENEADARTINPSGFVTHITDNEWMGTYSGGNNVGKEYIFGSSSWINFKDINQLSVEYIGEASEEQERGVVLASFNAG